MTVMTLLTDPALDAERLMLEDIDTSKGPLYSVSEMARFFFARSSYWARWLDTCHYTEDGLDYVIEDGKQVLDDKGEPKTAKVVVKCPLPPSAHDASIEHLDEHRRTWKLVLDGELLSPVRTASNARKYDLALIEKIAHALALNSTIKPSQLRQALLLVRIQAQMAGYLPMKMAVDTPPDLEELVAATEPEVAEPEESDDTSLTPETPAERVQGEAGEVAE